MKLYLTFYDRQSTLTKSPAKPTKAIDAVHSVPMAFLHLELRPWPDTEMLRRTAMSMNAWFIRFATN